MRRLEEVVRRRGARASASLALLVACGAAPAGCKSHHEAGPPPRPDAGAPPAASVGSGATPQASAGSTPHAAPDAGADAAATAGGRADGCPDGMLRVEGEYCPAVIEECIKEHPDYLARKNDPTVSERCLEYRNPSRCVSKERQHLAFCMDRYEYPNKVGEKPRVLVSWTQARDTCKLEGKRLCTEDEFNFACEGPDMLPYSTGFTREPDKCNMDKPYVFPDHEHRMLWYEFCLKNDRCSAELKRLDQRHAIGETNTCTSWAGPVDLNGNVNEWVDLPGKETPNRSGLKGGWWGPVRDRCRPTVIFHKENDYGYEVGFRCCKDVAGADAGAAAPAAKPATSAP